MTYLNHADIKDRRSLDRKGIDAVATCDAYHPEDRVALLDHIIEHATKVVADVRATNEQEGVPDRCPSPS